MTDKVNAIDIGGRLEVFWDRFLLDENQSNYNAYPQACLKLEKPDKKEIVLRLDKDWEGNTCGYFQYFHDGKKYRFYYRAGNGFSGKQIRKNSCICLLLSEDGINWERPDLGLVEFDGSKNNNIVFSADELDNFFIFKDENPECLPAEQYKAISQGRRSAEYPSGGLYVYVSPDGLSWTAAPRPLDINGAEKEHFFDSHNTAHWDRETGVYRVYFRGFHNDENGNRVRDIRLAVSYDFIRWDEMGALHYDSVLNNNDQLYTNSITPYYRAPHIRIGFPVRYVERKWEPMFDQFPNREWRLEKMERFNMPRLGIALTDGLFISSRNGLDFCRYDEPFLAPGIFRDYNWVYGDCYQGCGLVETSAGEISFFAAEDYTSRPVGIRRYAIRQDGFACFYAGAEPKQMTTRVFTFTGNTLVLNAATSAAGCITAEFLDQDGAPIPDYSGESGYCMFGDHTAVKTLFWRKKAAENNVAVTDLSPLAGKPVRLRFTLKEAKLYAMRFITGDL